MVNRLKYSQFAIQQSSLVLCEIANLDIMPYLECAEVVQLPHDTTNKGCLALTVLAYKRHFFATADSECSMLEYHVLTKIFAHIICYHRKITTTWCRRKTQTQSRVILHIHFQTLQLLQLLDTRLHLHSFGGFVAKTLNKLFGLLNHLLLILIRSHLLFMAFLAQYLKLGVRHVIIVYAPKSNLYGTRSHII